MSLANLKVMIVESDEFDAKMLTRALLAKEQAISVDWSPTIEHAKQFLEERVAVEKNLSGPCVVFVNLAVFGQKLGFEFLEELHGNKLLRKAVVFVLTASEDPKDIVRAYELNIAGYFSKQQVGENYSQLVAFLERYCEINQFPV